MELARAPEDGPGHDDVKRWLVVVRDGDARQQAGARARLAAIYEQRGMVAESIEMLEANVRLGAADDRQYARLLDLYRRRGTNVAGDGKEAAFVAGEPEEQRSSARMQAAAHHEARPGPESGRDGDPTAPGPRVVLAPTSGGGVTDVGRRGGGRAVRLVDPVGASVRLLALGGVIGALGATLAFAIWHGDWRLQAAVVSIAPMLLAGRWVTARISSGTAPVPRRGRLPAAVSLAVLTLLVSVVWLDGSTRATADVASAVVAQARPSGDAVAPETPSDAPARAAAEQSTGATSAIRVDGLLLEASPTRPRRDGAPGDSSPPGATRRPGLVVVDADGGVWLRAAPGDGRQIKLLSNGTPLVDLGESRDERGRRWRRVEDPGTGEGWIADAYIRDSASARRAEVARRQPLPATLRPIAPETAGYFATIQPRLQSVDEALRVLLAATTRAVERPRLLLDARWKAELASHVTVLQERVRLLQLVGASPELDQFSRSVAAASGDLAVAVHDLLGGLDALDPVRIGAATDRLDRVNEQLGRASSDLHTAPHGR